MTAERKPRVVELMEALERSVAEARAARDRRLRTASAVEQAADYFAAFPDDGLGPVPILFDGGDVVLVHRDGTTEYREATS